MRVCLATGTVGAPFAFDGGSQRAQHEFARRLVDRGCEVLTVCCLPPTKLELILRNTRQLSAPVQVIEPGQPVDPLGRVPGRSNVCLISRHGSAITVGASASDVLPLCRHAISQYRPDVVMTWLGAAQDIIRMAEEHHVPAVLRLFDPGNPQAYPRSVGAKATVIANAPVTAQAATRYYGRPAPFIVEPVDHRCYELAERTGDRVTFVNPTWPKGVALVCEIAKRLPHVPFLVVRGWSWVARAHELAVCRETLASLPNVQVVGPLADMREAYRRTKLVLMPSRWLEAWGRVVCEAQASGIPAIASSRGSLPLNVGDGGIILDYGDPQLWAQVIDQLYHDPQLYEQLSDKARRNIERFPFQTLIDRYVDLLMHVGAGKSVSVDQPRGPVTICRAQRNGAGRVIFVEQSIDWDDVVDLADPEHP